MSFFVSVILGKEWAMRSLEELSLIDDFLMNAVAQDQEVGKPCLRKILSVLLEREIDDVEIIPQKGIQGWTSELRGVRLDVEVREKRINDTDKGETIANVYDLEPHLKKDLNFPKYVRYRQARIDGNYVKRGDRKYEGLPDLYIITITNFDIFEENQMVYTFQKQCKEVPELCYEDGVKLVFFNAAGKFGGSQAIRNMLQYIRNSRETSAVDEATKEVNGFVRQIKTDPIIREGYMTFGEIIDRENRETAKNTRISTRVDSIIELLEDLGDVPDSLREKLAQIKDEEILKQLHKEAAHADSIEAFCLHMPIDL